MAATEGQEDRAHRSPAAPTATPPRSVATVLFVMLKPLRFRKAGRLTAIAWSSLSLTSRTPWAEQR